MPSRPMRVAHVIQNLNYGGMERVLHHLASQHASAGMDIHVVVLQYLGAFAEDLHAGVTLHHVPPMPAWSLLYPRALADRLAAIAPDIVHSHSGVWLKAARAARMARVPFHVHTEHGRPLPIPIADRCLDHLASKGTSVAVAVSEPLQLALQASVVHRRCGVWMIQNGVDTDRFRPSQAGREVRQSLGLPSSAHVIGSVGRLEPVKNYGLAIEALSQLHGRVAGGALPHLVLVGDGQDRPLLEDKAYSAGVAPYVHMLGWRADADQIYPAFDLFTLTSRSEGTSVSLLEAMSSGVCPVVTDVGGNRAVLGEALAGQLVPDNDVAALAAAWEVALANPTHRDALAQTAMHRAREKYSLTAMVSGYSDLYASLASSSSWHKA